jgi:hypothetical protein
MVLEFCNHVKLAFDTERVHLKFRDLHCFKDFCKEKQGNHLENAGDKNPIQANGSWLFAII